ncbi:hypothetical protein FRC03_009558 [Tulasnella sp. 419]|nr:hypothetical protein FRC03_009558 [Tulasnella sp. 419]
MSAEATPASASRMETFKNLISSIRPAKIQLQRPQQQAIPPQSSPSTPPSTNLFSPEDITSTLIHTGLEFKLARSVSQTYLDRAVQLQLASQSRLAAAQRDITPKARSSKVVSSLSQLQSKLRKSQERVYRRELKILFDKTIALAKDRLAKAKQPTEETSDDEDGQRLRTQSAEGSDEDPAAGDDGAANEADEKAFKEMSARSSVLLAKMYERGITFPKRHEKIRLSQETGLTYRQIGIWFSNRRERNRPGRGRESNSINASALELKSSHNGTRESTAESATDSDIIPAQPSLRAIPPPIHVRRDAMQIGSLNDGETVATPAEEKSWGSDDSSGLSAQSTLDSLTGCGPSLTASVATLDSVLPPSIEILPSSQSLDAPTADFFFHNLVPPAPNHNSAQGMFDFNGSQAQTLIMPPSMDLSVPMPLDEAGSNTHSLDFSSIFTFEPPVSTRPNVTFVTGVTATGAPSLSFPNLDVVNKYAVDTSFHNSGGTGVDAGLDSTGSFLEDLVAAHSLVPTPSDVNMSVMDFNTLLGLAPQQLQQHVPTESGPPPIHHHSKPKPFAPAPPSSASRPTSASRGLVSPSHAGSSSRPVSSFGTKRRSSRSPPPSSHCTAFLQSSSPAPITVAPSPPATNPATHPSDERASKRFKNMDGLSSPSTASTVTTLTLPSPTVSNLPAPPIPDRNTKNLPASSARRMASAGVTVMPLRNPVVQQ